MGINKSWVVAWVVLVVGCADKDSNVASTPLTEEDSASVEEPSEELESTVASVELLEASVVSPAVPAQIVFARLNGDGLGDEVIIEGILRETSTFVDIDENAVETYPLQVRLQGDNGEVIWQDSIREPIQIREFLGNALPEELESQIDLVNLIPNLGDFVFKIPVLEGARFISVVRIELDDAETELGFFDMEEVPDMSPYEFADAPVTKIVGKAPPEDALDIVILGDGYTEEEMGLFRAHAGKVSTQFTKVEPYSNYFERLNFYRVDIPSVESGASYDCSDKEAIEGCVDDFRDTAFESIFPLRLGVTLLDLAVSDRAIFQLDQWSVYQAASLAPYDTIVILVNTRKYGAFGIMNASLSAFLDNLSRVTIHELGHSFALLADEYIVEGDICQGYVLTPDYPNITPYQDSADDVKWNAWLTPNVPLPTPAGEDFSDAVGLFEGAGAGCLDYYRPKENCLMRSTSGTVPFCPICREQTVIRFYESFDYLSGPGIRLEGNTLYPVHEFEKPAYGEWRIGGEVVGDAAEPLVLEEATPGETVELDVELVIHENTTAVRRDREQLQERATARVKLVGASPEE